MKFFDPIIHLVNKPFPEQESNFGALKTNALVSVFVVFVLYVFQPFGMNSLESNRFLICLGFGISTFLSTALFEFTFTFLLRKYLENWTFGKWVLKNLGILLTISLVNFLYARIIIFGYILWEFLPHMIYGTLMIGIVPIIILGVSAITIQEYRYQNIAKQIPPRKQPKLKDSNSESSKLFDIPVSKIRFVEALQNYASIVYLDEENQLKKLTKRATLKQILDETNGNSIVQSHRSFLVNEQEIVSVSGNAQGLLLELSDCDKVVPVSRSFVSMFRN